MLRQADCSKPERRLLQPCHLSGPGNLLAAGGKGATLPKATRVPSFPQYPLLTGSLWKARSPGWRASRSRSNADVLHDRGFVLWLLRLAILTASKI